MLDDVEIEGEDSADEGNSSWLGSVRGGARTFSSGFIFLASLCLLFWNESYSKRHADGLNELAGAVRPAATATLDPANEGQPVHLSARVHSQAGARDPMFGVSTDGVAIYRQVEMYQWIEYEETTGRGRKKRTTYHYEMDWDSDYWDSSQFHQPEGHQNPRPTIESDGFFAADARFGPYKFDNDRVARQAVADSWNGEGLGSMHDWPEYLEQLPELSSSLQSKRWYQLDSATYYRGNQASQEAELGDLRATFFVLKNDYTLSMIARQEGEQLVDWQASNKDEILLAAGGNLDADTMIRIAKSEHSSFTSTLRLIGLAGAVIGAAGVANWLGGFLSMIPVVGSLVSVSLTIAGGLFGLMAGLVTIVIGWLAARPWVAAVLLIAIGSAVSWAIQKRRKADAADKRAKRAAGLAAAARERAAQAAQALAGGGPKPAMAGAPGTPPPPPPGGAPAAGAWSAKLAASPPPAPGAAAPRSAGPPPPPEPESKDLPPLEWTPGLIVTRPPSVRPQAETRPAPPAAPASQPPAARTPAPAPAAPPRAAAAPAAIPGFDLVDARPAAIPGFDLVEPVAKPAPAAPAAIPGFDIIDPTPVAKAPAAPAPRPAAPAQPAAAPAIPGFDLVDARPAAPIPGFETVEPNPFIKAAQNFDSGVRTRPDELFDTVPTRDSAAPRFDLMPMDESKTEVRQLDLQGALSTPKAPPAPAPAAPAVAAPATPAAAAPVAPTAAPRNVRIALGSKGEYQLAKIVRQHPDGRQEVICFELLRANQTIKRGTQEEVKEALRRALAGQG